ncbi:N(5)-(carboxyethyl)ornithine synthase [Tomitella biformata]|uniref:N(5)-(carboxyethyl)ornithine synthase n=1 Tax=Tomitella biformata TaxID=630403 RepID=UPI00046407CF|nr:N(5)-(carboxyethyl)ornithine synthase [Tomitella biformata]
MQHLTLGVIANSSKTDEQRLPIHPLHLDRVDADLLARMHFEAGYGEPFGISDKQLALSVAGIRTRAELIAESDVILLPKPQAADLAELRVGQVLWGWPHCVQDQELTQLAIDRKLTLIAFEAMNYWTSEGWFSLHVFHKNNELAGYCSVLHAMHLHGSTGHYGRRLNAVVIGFGATARGAVTALNALGIHDVHVVTQRGVTAVGSPIHSAEIVQMDSSDDADEADTGLYVTTDDDGRIPLAGFLTGHDIIVNCVLQDPNSPQMFLDEADLAEMAPGSLVVDVSCDEGMGFSWALPTTFADPTFIVGEDVRYYAVDHSPSYLWNSATWEISEALLPFLRTVLDGPAAWAEDPTLSKAVEIRDGVIVNPDILEFQHRGAEYPHAIGD